MTHRSRNRNRKGNHTEKTGRRLSSLLAVLLALFLLNGCEKAPVPDSGQPNGSGSADADSPSVIEPEDGENGGYGGSEEASGTAYEYALKTEVLSDSTDFEGTEIAAGSIEYPVLYVVSAGKDGKKTEAEKCGDNAGMFDICGIFNAEIAEFAEGCHAVYDDIADLALGLCKSDGNTDGILGTYTETASVKETVFTGDFVSVYAEESVYTGGAHPSGVSHTWNFDIRNGVFHNSYADIAKNEDELTEMLGAEISDSIYDEYGTAEYYPDFFENRKALLASSTFAFTEGGMKVCFDEYSIAPYAFRRIFDLPYSAVYSYLSEHLRSLLAPAVPDEQKVLAAYFRANKLYGFFDMCTMPLDYSEEKEGENGLPYNRVSYGGLESMQDLENLLLEVFTPECAGEILASHSELYCEFDGKLYGLAAARGSDITLGKAEYAVEENGNAGKIVATVEDYGENGPVWNEETGKWEAEVEGCRTFEFPYVIKDGRILFPAFDSIY